MLILSYDIQDDKLRSSFSKFILSYGRRIQYSVYEINNSNRVLEIIKVKIKERFEKLFGQGDSVLIFKINKENEILRFGYAKNEETDLVIY